MTIRDRIRRFLGIDDVATTAQVSAEVAALRAQIDALQIAAEAAAEQRKSEILAYLSNLQATLRAAHMDMPAPFAPPVLDWDTVQAIAARTLEQSAPPKELEEVYGKV